MYCFGFRASDFGFSRGDFPVSEDYANRIFSLPMHPYLKPEEQGKIAEVLAKG
jgi:UDP-2-acetamido-2-deoxy-ribo-hexuluronate aminotransferase